MRTFPELHIHQNILSSFITTHQIAALFCVKLRHGSILKEWHISIILKNNLAKFYPDPIWNDGALSFFEDGRPNKNKNNNKMSSDTRSVPGQKLRQTARNPTSTDMHEPKKCYRDNDTIYTEALLVRQARRVQWILMLAQTVSRKCIVACWITALADWSLKRRTQKSAFK